MRWADTRTCIARAQDEVDKLITIVQHPRQFKIPEWFLNRVKDRKVRDNARRPPSRLSLIRAQGE